MERYDVAIVGGGIAGYSAALTAKSLGLNYLWFAPAVFDGKTRAAEYVRNYPAFTGNGKAFSEALERQRRAEDISFLRARVGGIYKMGSEFYVSAGQESYKALAVILATGVERGGGIRGEREFLGRGVSYCAVCDGALYRKKTVAAVLYSAEFAEEVEYLAGFAGTVHCFCACAFSAFRAENIVLHEGLPDGIEGNGHVEKICKNGQTLSVSGVFFLKNSMPPAAICAGLETDGVHIVTKRDLSSSLGGVFAAGDVAGTPYQFAKAAGEGLVAAYSVRAYLAKLQKSGDASAKNV